ncbi:MAG: hypothetical protein K0R39_5013 [Symbiobacteriaceae bacterium]|jgi:uncharacterized protein YqgC (DUF456 family)|nr:hypothetical protein [Symbiobacteriaceae bacterium]
MALAWEWAAFAIALVVMCIGILGTFLPALPGIPLIWVAMLGYALFEGFEDIGATFLVVTFLVVALTQVAEHYSRAWGAKKWGAGKAGAWGAVIGSIAGLFFMPIGLVLGPFLGAMVFELIAGRETKDAFKAGIGGLVGVLGSILINVIVGIGMVIAFIIAAI